MTGISALVAAVCGAAIGVLFTVAHRATTDVAGIPFPYGIVLGIASAIAFLAAMRLLWDTRWPAIGGGIGLVAAILVLSFTGPGGSVIVRDDAYGWTWLILAPVAALAVIAWPRARTRRHAARRGASAGGDTIEGPEKPAEEYP